MFIDFWHVTGQIELSWDIPSMGWNSLIKSREDIRFEVSFDKLGPQLGDPQFIQHLTRVSTLRQLGWWATGKVENDRRTSTNSNCNNWKTTILTGALGCSEEILCNESTFATKLFADSLVDVCRYSSLSSVFYSSIICLLFLYMCFLLLLFLLLQNVLLHPLLFFLTLSIVLLLLLLLMIISYYSC